MEVDSTPELSWTSALHGGRQCRPLPLVTTSPSILPVIDESAASRTVLVGRLVEEHQLGRRCWFCANPPSNHMGRDRASKSCPPNSRSRRISGYQGIRQLQQRHLALRRRSNGWKLGCICALAGGKSGRFLVCSMHRRYARPRSRWYFFSVD